MALEQVIAQPLQIALVVGTRQPAKRLLVVHDVGIVFGDIVLVRQVVYFVPKRLFERPRCGAREGERIPRHRRRVRFDDPAQFPLHGPDPAAFGRMACQRSQPFLVRLLLSRAQQVAREGARQRLLAVQLEGVEQ